MPVISASQNPTSVISAPQNPVLGMLMELGIPLHRVGCKALCSAIPRFRDDDMQTLSKELYPAVAAELGCSDWRAVEHAIRDVIVCAWKRRDPAVWAKYFPGCRKPPSNKRFIATLAQFVR